MKNRIAASILFLALAAALPSRATEISLTDLSATPDGTIKVDFQHTDVKALNGGVNVLPNTNGTVAYVISKFNFGTASDAHLQWAFSTSASAANRIGVEVQDTGLVQTINTNNGILQAISPTTNKRTTVNLNQDMAGQTVTLLAKLYYNSAVSTDLDARTSFNGTQSTSDDTIMNVWINPAPSDVEGNTSSHAAMISNGDLYAVWNSVSFQYFRQIIQNQSTPATSGDSSITDTVILTGADATFVKALAIATGATPGVVSAYISTVSSSPTTVPADGVTTSTVTVTLKDGFGDPISGKEVTLANTAGPQAAVIDPLTPVTTDANGQATFTVKSSTAGIEEFTATDTTDSLVINQTASVAFISSADAGESTVVASPTYVNADGTSLSTITVTLKAQGGIPTPGKEVTLAGAPATAAISPAGSQVTDSNGQVAFAVSSSTPGQVVFTATDVTDGIVVTQTAGVDFAGPAAAGTSTVTASAAAVVANGTSLSTITVSLKDSAGIPVVGEEVTLAGLPAVATVDPAGSQFTDANGQCTFDVSSSTAGTVEFTATAVGAGVSVTQTATVEFIDSSVPLAFNVSFVQFTPGLGNFEDPSTLAGPAGGSGENWNQIRAASGGSLFGSNGEVTSVGVTTNFSECRQRNDTGLVLLRDGLTDFAKGLSRTVTISGLPPGSLYNVWLASSVSYGGTENGSGIFSTSNPTTTVGGQAIDQTVSANTTTWEQGNNYVLFENVTVDGAGEIQITAAASTGYRLPLNGLQLAPASGGRIVAFEAAGATGVIDQGALTIDVTVPFGTDLATLAPTFVLNSGVCDQTSGSPPDPTFATQNPVDYFVTDSSTDPVTVNTYSVTVTVAPAIGTLVIDLGSSPGTAIEGGGVISSGPTNLPLALPPGSILRSISVDTTLAATDNDNWANELSLLFGPSAGTYTHGFISSGANFNFAPTQLINWGAGLGEGGTGTPFADGKTDADWTGDIDLGTAKLFLGNSHQQVGWVSPEGGTWSGTITLTYDIVPSGTPYQTWATGGELFGGDANGDGVANGMAFLLGASGPNANALGLLPAPTEQNGGDLVLSFSMRNAANRGASVLKVQWSADLGVGDLWSANEAVVPDADGTVNGVVFDITAGDPLNTVTATIPAAEAGGTGKLFGRLSGAEN